MPFIPVVSRVESSSEVVDFKVNRILCFIEPKLHVIVIDRSNVEGTVLNVMVRILHDIRDFNTLYYVQYFVQVNSLGLLNNL
jgi:hypothetical protein